MKKLIIISLFLCFAAFAQEVIDINVKGISDNKNEGAQKDRKEAVMDAKRQACEKAGLQIKSKTTVENFQTVFDHIESESEAVLLPGFQIIDIGYVADGTYQVVLTGKIKMVEEEEEISAKELRYAKSLYDREKYSDCKQILEKYINNKENNAPEELQEESLYLYIKWGFSFNALEDCEKYAAFYPDSPKVDKLLKYGEFSTKPIIKYSKDFSVNHSIWEKGEFIVDDNVFTKKNVVFQDTILLKDFSGNNVTLIVEYIVFKNNLTNADLFNAYILVLKYWKSKNKKPISEDIIVIDKKEKMFSKKGSKTFQHSSSGKWFENFKLKNYQIKGNLPVVHNKKTNNLKFDIYQNGF